MNQQTNRFIKYAKLQIDIQLSWKAIKKKSKIFIKEYVEISNAE